MARPAVLARRHRRQEERLAPRKRGFFFPEREVPCIACELLEILFDQVKAIITVGQVILSTEVLTTVHARWSLATALLLALVGIDNTRLRLTQKNIQITRDAPIMQEMRDRSTFLAVGAFDACGQEALATSLVPL